MAPFTLLKKPDDIDNQLLIALDRLEHATELIKAWVGYANGHLSDTEKILLQLYKEFLGENSES